MCHIDQLIQLKLGESNNTVDELGLEKLSSLLNFVNQITLDYFVIVVNLFATHNILDLDPKFQGEAVKSTVKFSLQSNL